MSLLRYKQKLLPYGNAMGGDGGGGGGGSTTSTSYNTNIPEYAKPYVTGMLEATQKQIYNDDRTSFRPYTPYSTDVNNYFAGFSPLQQQAQYESANMQQPGQFGLGSGLAGMAGMGSLGAGQQYAAGVTSPQAMQAYMSPYQQNVTDIAKMNAVREAQMAQNTQNLGAARQGTYGGARQTLAQTEREKNLLSNLSNIQAQGSQSAFDRALQSQQFGANLGMQGYGQAGQAASTLGQLGSSQQAADIARQNQMSQMGKQQQDLEQQKINQAIQTYAIQQQYPQMQLGFMSNMLRGLPLQAQTTQLYQAQPSIMQQGVGLLGAGASLFGRKEGGAIKEYREGGVASVPGYKYGKLISEPKLESMADDLTIPQLQQRLKDPALTPGERQVFAEALQEKMQQEKSRMSGIAMAGGPAFESQGMAGGGILAFAPGGDIEDPEQIDPETGLPYKSVNPVARFTEYMNPFSGKGSLGSIARGGKSVEEVYNKPKNISADDRLRQAQAEADDKQEGPGVVETPIKKEEKVAAKEGTSGKAGAAAATSKDFKSFLAEMKEAGPKGEAGAEYEKYLAERLGKSGERLSRDERMAMAKGFLKFASTPSPGGIGQAAAAGLGEYVTGIEGARKAQDTMEAEAQKARMELDKARRAEQRGDVTGAREAYDKYEDRMTRIQAAQIGAGAAGAPQRYTEQQIRNVMAENPGMSYGEAMTRVAGAGRMENVEVQRAKVALASIDDRLGLMGKKDPRRADLEAQRTEIIRLLTPGGGIGGGQATQTAGATPSDIQNILNKYPPR